MTLWFYQAAVCQAVLTKPQSFSSHDSKGAALLFSALQVTAEWVNVSDDNTQDNPPAGEKWTEYLATEAKSLPCHVAVQVGPALSENG